MKLIKSLLVVACVFSMVAVTVRAEDGKDKDKTKMTCCEKAKAKGKECTHKCCIEAKKDGKVCEKCNPKKDDKK